MIERICLRGDGAVLARVNGVTSRAGIEPVLAGISPQSARGRCALPEDPGNPTCVGPMLSAGGCVGLAKNCLPRGANGSAVCASNTIGKAVRYAVRRCGGASRRSPATAPIFAANAFAFTSPLNGV